MRVVEWPTFVGGPLDGEPVQWDATKPATLAYVVATAQSDAVSWRPHEGGYEEQKLGYAGSSIAVVGMVHTDELMDALWEAVVRETAAALMAHELTGTRPTRGVPRSQPADVSDSDIEDAARALLKRRGCVTPSYEDCLVAVYDFVWGCADCGHKQDEHGDAEEVGHQAPHAFRRRRWARGGFGDLRELANALARSYGPQPSRSG